MPQFDDGECSDLFPVEQDLSQRFVLVPFEFSILCATVIHVALTRFKLYKDAMDALTSARKKAGAGRWE